MIINPSDGQAVQAQVFDTYKSCSSIDWFVNKYFPDDYIVVAACKDECVSKLSWGAK